MLVDKTYSLLPNTLGLTQKLQIYIIMILVPEEIIIDILFRESLRQDCELDFKRTRYEKITYKNIITFCIC